MTAETKLTIIAGGAGDYLEARYVFVRGTNREIGRAVAEIAQREFDSRPLGALDRSSPRSLHAQAS